MADEPKRASASEEITPPIEGDPQAKSAWYRRFLRWPWLAALVAVPLLLHGVGLTYCYVYGVAGQPKPTHEMALGEYRFRAKPGEAGAVEAAQFSVHIALLEHVADPARARLRDREHRVRQNIEELLRQAHGADFEDPTLGGIKRQLQERINDTLEMRAISDVIITNLAISPREGLPDGRADETAEVAAWSGPPSGLTAAARSASRGTPD